MIRLEEARARVLALVTPMPQEIIPLVEAQGRVLAMPVLAAWPQPAQDLSAMDGYAVLSDDLANTPTDLVLMGESAAGHGFDGALRPGHAIRVSTGAEVPAGADQIVIQENTKREADILTVMDEPRPGAHIRRTGQDFITDEVLGQPGLRLRGESLALLAAGGTDALPVARRPRIGVMASGDELVALGEWPGPGQIVNSVTPGLMGLIKSWGGQAVDLGIARDAPQSVADKLEKAKTQALDLVITIGGASVGDHDHLRQVFQDRGGSLSFEKIAVKPGKPTWFGQLGEQLFLGLPGNPVSALVVARLLLKPAIERMLGQDTALVLAKAKTTQALPANGPREMFLRAEHVEGDQIRPFGKQDSSVVSALAKSTCLIRRDINAPPVETGGEIEILRLD
ncbi:MAG: molybdopterin molybdotransferase MoeA [Alphaproteobacteria bacterium]|nr:molybdopterin molybdotransferase MoeA [Alphaproteobacteria bacterium]